eukprot:TRINITY_DN3181_c0_g1_i12.p1 TRINITY_DN3181_c0_g1~~TRINITY_DN3181_c0_g1_i12.p1  ORF type:complete len:187 (-),score=12.39 TRINITY_DN3181_c0_g1_i12:3-563(-)
MITELELPMFKWTHVVIVYTDNTINYYFNGRKVSDRSYDLLAARLEQLKYWDRGRITNVLLESKSCFPFAMYAEQVVLLHFFMKYPEPPKNEQEEKERHQIKQNTVEHRNWLCDTCLMPIVGVHYKCTYCRYDLCSNCYGNPEYPGRNNRHNSNLHIWGIEVRPNQLARRYTRIIHEGSKVIVEDL